MVELQGDARDFTDISSELALRTGLTERYVAAINRGAAGVPLKSDRWDFTLDPSYAHSRDQIWDAVCRAASAELTDGAEDHGLDWWKANGLRTRPFSRTEWYLSPILAEQGLRFELPYQERLARVGKELGRRMHEKNMHWWDAQLAEYQALPAYKDFPKLWEDSVSAGRAARGLPGYSRRAPCSAWKQRRDQIMRRWPAMPGTGRD